jgi:thiol-disulfide isomerase/thioredoxin
LIKYIAAIFLVLGPVAPVAANPDFDLGPPIGTQAPTIGTPQDETGKPRSLESLMGDRGLVLFFFRSAAWCPFCQAIEAIPSTDRLELRHTPGGADRKEMVKLQSQ